MRFPGTVAGLHSFRYALAIACLASCGASQAALASQATVTTLFLTASGNPVSSVAGGTVVTLTASVQAGATALTLGQVNFCDSSVGSCTDIQLVGTAQLTSAGTAVLRVRPGPGSHSYKALFLGTLDAAASTSVATGLTVGPPLPGPQTTYTGASASGPLATNVYGTYALTASIGTKGPVPPSGTVSFSGTNSATGNPFSLPGTATLGPLNGGTGFLNVPIPEPNNNFADALPLVRIGDFNGDGISDIVSAPHGGIAVSLGNGDGTFAAPLIPNVDSVDGINAFGLGDFNGDGITDLLVADEDTGSLTVLLGKGDGTFTVGQSMPDPAASLAVADFNNDGRLDVALAGSSQATVLLGNGDGTFTAAPNPLPASSLQVVAADFDGDGKIDLAAVSGTGNSVTILLGNGDGTFTPVPSQPQFAASQVAAADFNRDGRIDLVFIDPTGSTVNIVLGNGDGTFTAPSNLPTDSNFGALALVVADFNGDGKPDVAIAARANNPATTPAAKVSIIAGNGDGTFAERFDVALVAGDLTSLAAADLTGNGSSDLSTFGSVFLGNLAITTATANNVLPAGDDIIQANYQGDANNTPSSSKNEPAIFVPQQTFSLTSKPVTVNPGASVIGSFAVTSLTFSGTLDLSCSIYAPQSQANAPSCSVQPTISFFSSGGTDSLAYTVTTQATTPAGQYSITITAADAAGGVPPLSTSAMVSVAAPVPPGFTLSGTDITIASPGPNATSTITISPSGGFTGSVALSCAFASKPMGAVDAPACSVTTPPAIVGAAAVTATLTITTTEASNAANVNSEPRNQHRPGGLAIGSTAIAMASLLLVGFPIRRRRRMVQVMLLLIATWMGTTIGCAGTKAVAPLANPGTTPGTYTLTVAGSSGSIMASTAVNVTVN